MNLTRREVLLALAASGCVDTPGELTAADGFPCGVSSADATPTNVLLWTMYSGEQPLFAEWWPLDDSSAVQRLSLIHI